MFIIVLYDITSFVILCAKIIIKIENEKQMRKIADRGGFQSFESLTDESLSHLACNEVEMLEYGWRG